MRFRNTFAAILVAASATAASAADIYTKAPPPVVAPPQVIGWTGLYFGLTGGYGWESGDVNVLGVTAFEIKPGGWMVGPQIGYDYRFGNLVLGAVADWSWANIKGSGNFAGVLTTEAKLDQFATARVRAGFLPFESLLLYGTGGVAMGHFSAATNLGKVNLANESATKYGWTLGAGAEYAITQRWFAHVEYLYSDLGSLDQTVLGVTGSVPIRLSTARLGLTFKF